MHRSFQVPRVELPQRARTNTASSADVAAPVTFDVVVTSEDGNPISGLHREHFRVFDNKVQQTITMFAGAEAPVTVAILAEFRYVDGFAWHDVTTPISDFIRTLRKDDFATLLSYDLRTITLVDFTTDKMALLNGLEGLTTPAYRVASFHDAVANTLDRLTSITGRKALFLLSSGWDSGGNKNFSETIRKAEASNTTIYVISLGTGFAMPTHLSYWTYHTLLSYAQRTGGTAFFPDTRGQYFGIYHEPEKSLNEVVQTISSHLQHQYSIGFVPQKPDTEGKEHRIQVEVVDVDIDGDGKDDRFTVRHRPSY
jgi:VWFA-related protein